MVDDVDPQNLLQMEIGRIAQHHVHLDSTLRRVFVLLAAPSPAMFLANDNFSTASVIRSCKTMLANAQVPDQVIQAGLVALHAAKCANEARNRVVHDLWLPDPFNHEAPASSRWDLAKIARGAFGMKDDGTHDLESVRASRREVLRAHYMVFGLVWALNGTLPALRGPGLNASPMDWIAVMEGRLVPDGDDYRTDE